MEGDKEEDAQESRHVLRAKLDRLDEYPVEGGRLLVLPDRTTTSWSTMSS